MGVTELNSDLHNGYLQLAKLMIRHGVDLVVQMENSETASDIAERESRYNGAPYCRFRKGSMYCPDPCIISNVYWLQVSKQEFGSFRIDRNFTMKSD